MSDASIPRVRDKYLTIDFFQFPAAFIQQALEAAGFCIEELIERERYAGVDDPARHASIFARKPDAPALM